MTVWRNAIAPGRGSGLSLFMLHSACFLLVVLYVNMFQFWAWVSREVGPGLLAKMLPILVTLAVLMLISLGFVNRVNRGYRIRLVFLGLGIVAAFVALAVPDPGIPIKRVHVAEYIVLAFPVRYALSYRLRGGVLTLFAVLITALYGVHDEMLQGLHPLRYFGWRDMIVNGLGGLSGSMLGHGLVCFDRQEPGRTGGGMQNQSTGEGLSVAFLLASVVWMVAYLYRHHEETVAYPALLPVVLCSGIIAFFYPQQIISSTKNHGLQAVFWLSLGLVAYPVVAGLSQLDFR